MLANETIETKTTICIATTETKVIQFKSLDLAGDKSWINKFESIVEKCTYYD